MKRHIYVAGAFITALVVLGVAQSWVGSVAQAQARNSVMAPRFEVDPLWPKPMPNHWLFGNSIGVWVDEQDDVWMVHRGEANLNRDEKGIKNGIAECCAPAPPVLAFDKAGNLVSTGADLDKASTGRHRTTASSSITRAAVWIGGNGPGDSHIVKFTKDGKFLAQYGKPNARFDRQGPEGTEHVHAEQQ